MRNAPQVAPPFLRNDPLSRQMMAHIDVEFYGVTYLKRAVDKFAAFDHYVRYGHDQGYWPNPRFDTSFYRFLGHDTLALNALKHWVGWGQQQQRLTFGLRRPELIKSDDVIDLRGRTVIRQQFVATADYLSCIVVPIGSYNNQNNSAIFICVTMIEDETDDTVVAQYTFDGRFPSQHEAFTIYFDPVPHSKGRLFEISMKSTAPDDYSAAWPIYVKHGEHPATIHGIVNSFKYEMLLEEKYSPPYSPVSIPSKLLSPDNSMQSQLHSLHFRSHA